MKKNLIYLQKRKENPDVYSSKVKQWYYTGSLGNTIAVRKKVVS